MWQAYRHVTKMNFKKYKELIVGTIAFIILFNLWMWDIDKGRDDNKVISQTELTEIKATLSNKPTIETAEQGGPWVPIKLKEFPEFKFDVGEVKYSALNAREFVNEVSIGDSILLSILTYDYETKIKKEKSLRTFETVINYKFIEPYLIQSKGKVYMTLADVNTAWQDNHNSSIWLLYWTLGIIAFVGLVYSILRLTGFNRRFVKWCNDIQTSH